MCTCPVLHDRESRSAFSIQVPALPVDHTGRACNHSPFAQQGTRLIHIRFNDGQASERTPFRTFYIFTRDRFNDGQASERRSATRRTRHGGAVGRLYLGPRDLDARRLSGQCRPTTSAPCTLRSRRQLSPSPCTLSAPRPVYTGDRKMALLPHAARRICEGKTCHSLCHSSVVVPFRKGLRRVQLRHEMPLMRSLACEPSKKMLLALFAITPVAEARPA